MSRILDVPAMAHSANYHVPQQRQLDTSPQPPLPIADVIITSRQSVDKPTHLEGHLSSTSHVSYPRAVHSLSDPSYTQPASLANVMLTSYKSLETVHEDGAHRYGRGAGHDMQSTMTQDQKPSHPSPHVLPADHTLYSYIRDGSLDERVESRDRVLWILIRLSCFCHPVSVIICLYAIGALVMITLLAPLHLCFKGRSYSQQIVRLLSPSLDAQIYFIRSSENITRYGAPMLVLVHLLSPFVSLGVAVAAWVAASFWFYAAIIGDPGGTHGRDDGRVAVLGVRSWWESWLMRASNSTVEEWA